MRDERLGSLLAKEVLVDGELSALESGQRCGEDVFDVAGADYGDGSGNAELGGVGEDAFRGAARRELDLKAAVSGLYVGERAVDDLVAENAGLSVVLGIDGNPIGIHVDAVNAGRV